jgi:hypothetical protein
MNSSTLVAQRSTSNNTSAWDELHKIFAGRVSTALALPVSELAAQSIIGHRLWREASGRRERFLPIERIAFVQDKAKKEIWTTIEVRSELLSRRGRGAKEVLNKSGLGSSFRVVEALSGSVRFEQLSTLKYSHRPSDVVMELVDSVRPLLWQTVVSTSPYRSYYLYITDGSELRLPQIMSVYAFMFWLGSMTRYQPTELLALLESSYGAFIREFLATQPMQLVYMFASEFKHRDVSRGAIA